MASLNCKTKNAFFKLNGKFSGEYFCKIAVSCLILERKKKREIVNHWLLR